MDKTNNVELADRLSDLKDVLNGVETAGRGMQGIGSTLLHEFHGCCGLDMEHKEGLAQAGEAVGLYLVSARREIDEHVTAIVEHGPAKEEGASGGSNISDSFADWLAKTDPQDCGQLPDALRTIGQMLHLHFIEEGGRFSAKDAEGLALAVEAIGGLLARGGASCPE